MTVIWIMRRWLHPESHQRLEVLYQMLKEPHEGNYRFSRAWPPGGVGIDHMANYINLVASTAGRSMTMLDRIPTPAPIYETARLAAGGPQWTKS
jgi:hypothetical protein